MRSLRASLPRRTSWPGALDMACGVHLISGAMAGMRAWPRVTVCLLTRSSAYAKHTLWLRTKSRDSSNNLASMLRSYACTYAHVRAAACPVGVEQCPLRCRLLASFQSNLEEITIIATPDEDATGGPASRAVQLHSFVDPLKSARHAIHMPVLASVRNTFLVTAMRRRLCQPPSHLLQLRLTP